MTSRISRKIETVEQFSTPSGWVKHILDLNFTSPSEKEVQKVGTILVDLVNNYSEEKVLSLLHNGNIVRSFRRFLLAIMTYNQDEKIEVATRIFKGLFKDGLGKDFDFDRHMSILDNLTVGEIRLLGEAWKKEAEVFVFVQEDINRTCPNNTYVFLLQYHAVYGARSPAIGNGLFLYRQYYEDYLLHFQGIGLVRRISPAKHHREVTQGEGSWAGIEKDSTYYINSTGQKSMRFLSQ